MKSGTIVEVKISPDIGYKNIGERHIGIFVGEKINGELMINWVAGGPNYRQAHYTHDYTCLSDHIVNVLGEIENDT